MVSPLRSALPCRQDGALGKLKFSITPRDGSNGPDELALAARSHCGPSILHDSPIDVLRSGQSVYARNTQSHLPRKRTKLEACPGSNDSTLVPGISHPGYL